MGWLASSSALSEEPTGAVPNVSPPKISVEEIMSALGVEMSKIRIVGIPQGKQVTIELVEWTHNPSRSRSIAHLSVTPETDWVEFLISARQEEMECSRFNIKLTHKNPFYWEWPIDIKKRFGSEKRAIPLEGVDGFLNIASNAFRYEGQRLQVATFRLSGDKTHRHYVISLNAL